MTANPAAEGSFNAAMSGDDRDVPVAVSGVTPAQYAAEVRVVEPAPPAPETFVLQDVLRSLTGFDELAVEGMFGRPVMTFDSTWLGRVALFVLRRRAGATDAEAHREAMTATIGAIDDLFRDADEAADESQSLDEYLAGGSRPQA